MFDALVNELSDRYGLGDRGRDLFGLMMGYIHNDRRGGFNGFVEGFREQGLGDHVSSWIGGRAGDASLNASDVGMVFGQGLLSDWGNRLGTSRAMVAAAIAGVLPRLVSELTPGGRVPGGFATSPAITSTTSATERAAPVTAVPDEHYASRETPPAAASFDLQARPGVDGLVPSPADHRPAPSHVTSGDPVETQADVGRFVPAADLRRNPGPGPMPSSPTPVRSPVQARHDHDARIEPTLDPAEQRLADMTAAFDRHDDRGHETMRASGHRPLPERPDSWRPAVHPPKKRGWGGLFWVLLVVAILAGAAWYAWTLGLFDPYIRQFNLAVPVSSTPDPR